MKQDYSSLYTAQGLICRALWAFPGSPWRRMQNGVGQKTDNKGKEQGKGGEKRPRG